MIIYRFRLTSEDHDDFLREIEIQPGQTFLDFHHAIQSCADLEKCDNAFFYTTDNKFKKKQEISFKLQKKLIRKYDDDTDQVITETYVPNLMKESLLKNFVEDPHQRMIYEFTGKDSFVLFIELFRIIKTEEFILLPRCVTAKGHLPKKAQLPVPPPEEEPGEKPPAMRVPPPAVVPGDKSMFSEMQEDEAEIAEIESQLDELMQAGKLSVPGKSIPRGAGDEADPFTGEGDEEEDESRMESLEDYEDIEDLENKTRHFEGEADDY
jgi:hypothetical protein